MAWFTHEFEAPIERYGIGRTRKIWYAVVFVPGPVAGTLPLAEHPQLRIEGEIADIPVKSAVLSAGDGRHYVMVSPETLKAASLRLGQRVDVRFRVADQTQVDVPAELQEALDLDADGLRAWNALTVGRRRGLAHFIDSAKTAATRERRVSAVITAITNRRVTAAVKADVARLSRLLGKR
jgi:hypothetical protein